MKNETISGKFNRKWIPEPNSGCWLWVAGVNSDGYGELWTGRQTKAHRVSWTIFRGEIPTGMQVLHRCDVRSCVNPDHLFLGTNADNVRDCLKKGRFHTKRKWFSKLNESDVLQILSSSDTSVALAAKFGVTDVTIYKIRNRQTWKHLSQIAA